MKGQTKESVEEEDGMISGDMKNNKASRQRRT
jgi:hypothetical protein